MSDKWIKDRDAAAMNAFPNKKNGSVENNLHWAAQRGAFAMGYDAAREQFLKDLGPVKIALEVSECFCGRPDPLSLCQRCEALEILDALGVKS